MQEKFGVHMIAFFHNVRNHNAVASIKIPSNQLNVTESIPLQTYLLSQHPANRFN